MGNFLELARTLYATKRYDSSQKIVEEKIEELKEILRLTPSSINCQPWLFSFISDEKTKTVLAGYSFFNEHKINSASHIVVFSGFDDLNAFEGQIPYIFHKVL
ncbi:nitroreductase family protein [Elizabethkingia meningoseptica]|uniref:nitroreductase family protein n=1 Tax=Elizabethkingia meningoseptica TaxID=238 RepID=UPI003891C739